jgi:linoleoyl-CoA desaturase
MYLKTAAILGWFIASYVLLVFVAANWWQGVLLSFSLALAMAGIGFAIQHDANHGAYSKLKAINRLLGLTLDMLGGSSYVWHWKHNVSHHTYPNLHGVDDDLDILPWGRLAPNQPRRRIYSIQHYYLWPLYGFLLPKWHFVDDIKNLTQARVGGKSFPRPRGWRLAEVIGGKALFFGWAFLVPMLFHPWWQVLLFYAGTAAFVGISLSIVFQLAHCVENAEFPEVATVNGENREWALHQLNTTVNFSRRNPILTWYLGGLNYQIEHHLFPRICHVHYPRVSRIVESVCKEWGVRYNTHKGVFSALASHWRWLRRMGRPVNQT